MELLIVLSAVNLVTTGILAITDTALSRRERLICFALVAGILQIIIIVVCSVLAFAGI